MSKNINFGRPRTGGFTLVELVTSLVLVGVLTAVAVPRMMDGDDVFTQRGYTDDIAASIRYARSIAIASQCEVRVSINVGDYVVQQRATQLACNNPASPWTTPVRRYDGGETAGVAPTDVSAAGAVALAFDRNGSIAVKPNDIAIGPFTISVDTSGLVTVLP